MSTSTLVSDQTSRKLFQEFEAKGELRLGQVDTNIDYFEFDLVVPADEGSDRLPHDTSLWVISNVKDALVFDYPEPPNNLEYPFTVKCRLYPKRLLWGGLEFRDGQYMCAVQDDGTTEKVFLLLIIFGTRGEIMNRLVSVRFNYPTPI